MEFLRKTGFTLDQAIGTVDIPIAEVIAIPFKLGKPLVTERGRDQTRHTDVQFTQMVHAHVQRRNGYVWS